MNRPDKDTLERIVDDVVITLTNEHAFYTSTRGAIAALQAEFKRSGSLDYQSEPMKLAVRRWLDCNYTCYVCQAYGKRMTIVEWHHGEVIYHMPLYGKWTKTVAERLVSEYRDDIIAEGKAADAEAMEAIGKLPGTGGTIGAPPPTEAPYVPDMPDPTEYWTAEDEVDNAEVAKVAKVPGTIT